MDTIESVLPMTLGILLFSFLVCPGRCVGRRSVHADHLRSERSVWNSGAIDARLGDPIGFDGSADYILEYTEERDRLRQEELLEAIDEIKRQE